MRQYFYHTIPPAMPKRETSELVLALKEILDNAKMTNASFFTFDQDGGKKNEELKETTRLYRQAYLIAPLEILIKRYDKVQ